MCVVTVADIHLQATKSGIPPGARWTKIDRRLVNPEALEDAKERFEERLDCVIVLRVLSKPEIQKLADRTSELRGKYNRSHSPTSLRQELPHQKDLEQHDKTRPTRQKLQRSASEPDTLPS